ncbi:hypothetical protein SEA_ZION_55 [Corynebacterium phage Zion]|uniref:Uncharacterized protein n=5 Tax=Ceetrepovirus TaxID=2560111 RepID=A0A2H4P8Z8_9CAUD|nr:hypothetical protein FDJ10_gp90 [Corynebacterium phage C3PO]YP_009620396.1 hypothetical protein FDJ12_gp89 [Corynebacterium phage Zion]ATW58704.1 hypothetical protein SEA_POTATOCHIP_55 [Corynebacterium phage PotatoChip]AYQ98349.1 hypothetical protein CRUELLA_53 [Corynebacterium phage Cruella]AYR03368.1 hypothetical protein PETEYPAB_54 [Corynebacterium phage PeteyPab]ATW58453.1 hypothetical protein SEA_C3PO_53 [Corynebacterium phage C3PO]ATW58857.1 hypothetical protein SEA_ZION_55 [Coryneba
MTNTLANMTPDERPACVGMWCKMGENWLIIMWIDGDEVGLTSPAWTAPFFETAAKITPRFDIPRAWMPDGTPVKDA